ncbi:MAG: ASCH domain-containing protein [Chloroflexi bacterium]|nr:ASCH domain-containing protein [Chloroflexota bacterium]
MATNHDPVAAFWAEYVAAAGATGAYTAWGFGDDGKPELMTKLGLLVRDGPKRATTGLEADYGDGSEPLPRVGDHSVILDGEGRPLCIIRTTAVEIRPFGAVDEAFAWDEGENDRTLAGWRAAHEWYFDTVGTLVDDDTRVVLERFAKVWPPPPDAAD